MDDIAFHKDLVAVCQKHGKQVKTTMKNIKSSTPGMLWQNAAKAVYDYGINIKDDQDKGQKLYKGTTG